MIRISTNEHRITPCAKAGEWVTEASDLDLRPGEWPLDIELALQDGSTVHMRRTRPEYSGVGIDRELSGWVYLSLTAGEPRGSKMTLTVLND